ncbi:F184B protein, partial [Turnix velox]|nr:F184B protein [Turnix velox]
VIYALNMRNDEHEASIQALKEAHEEEMQRILAETRETILQCKSRAEEEQLLRKRIQALEVAVEQHKRLKEEALAELTLCKQQVENRELITEVKQVQAAVATDMVLTSEDFEKLLLSSQESNGPLNEYKACRRENSYEKVIFDEKYNVDGEAIINEMENPKSEKWRLAEDYTQRTIKLHISYEREKETLKKPMQQSVRETKNCQQREMEQRKISEAEEGLLLQQVKKLEADLEEKSQKINERKKHSQKLKERIQVDYLCYLNCKFYIREDIETVLNFQSKAVNKVDELSHQITQLQQMTFTKNSQNEKGSKEVQDLKQTVFFQIFKGMAYKSSEIAYFFFQDLGFFYNSQFCNISRSLSRGTLAHFHNLNGKKVRLMYFCEKLHRQESEFSLDELQTQLEEFKRKSQCELKQLEKEKEVLTGKLQNSSLEKMFVLVDLTDFLITRQEENLIGWKCLILNLFYARSSSSRINGSVFMCLIYLCRSFSLNHCNLAILEVLFQLFFYYLTYTYIYVSFHLPCLDEYLICERSIPSSIFPVSNFSSGKYTAYFSGTCVLLVYFQEAQKANACLIVVMLMSQLVAQLKQILDQQAKNFKESLKKHNLQSNKEKEKLLQDLQNTIKENQNVKLQLEASHQKVLKMLEKTKNQELKETEERLKKEFNETFKIQHQSHRLEIQTLEEKAKKELHDELEQIQKQQTLLLGSLRMELLEQQTSCTNLKKQIEELQMELRSVRMLKVQQARTYLNQIRSLHDELEKCQSEISELKKENLLLKDTMELLSAELESQKQEAAQLQDREKQHTRFALNSCFIVLSRELLIMHHRSSKCDVRISLKFIELEEKSKKLEPRSEDMHLISCLQDKFSERERIINQLAEGRKFQHSLLANSESYRNRSFSFNPNTGCLTPSIKQQKKTAEVPSRVVSVPNLAS